MEKEFEWINDFSKPFLKVWVVSSSSKTGKNTKVYLATPHEGGARKVASFLIARGVKAVIKAKQVIQQKKQFIQGVEYDNADVR